MWYSNLCVILEIINVIFISNIAQFTGDLDSVSKNGYVNSHLDARQKNIFFRIVV